MSWIKDLKDGDKVATELLVNNVTKGVTDKGLTYLNISYKLNYYILYNFPSSTIFNSFNITLV